MGDEEDISASMKTVVESAGYEAKTVNSGKSALETLQQERFDLVLLAGRVALENDQPAARGYGRVITQT